MIEAHEVYEQLGGLSPHAVAVSLETAAINQQPAAVVILGKKRYVMTVDSSIKLLLALGALLYAMTGGQIRGSTIVRPPGPIVPPGAEGGRI
jgi:hypothetical protein